MTDYGESHMTRVPKYGDEVFVPSHHPDGHWTNGIVNSGLPSGTAHKDGNLLIAAPGHAKSNLVRVSIASYGKHWCWPEDVNSGETAAPAPLTDCGCTAYCAGDLSTEARREARRALIPACRRLKSDPFAAAPATNQVTICTCRYVGGTTRELCPMHGSPPEYTLSVGGSAAPATPTTAPISILIALARPRDWSEDFAHENGQYMNHCHICHCTFFGHKRRVTCKSCSKAGASPSVEEDSEPCDGHWFADHFCTLRKGHAGDCRDEAGFTWKGKVGDRNTVTHPAREGAPTDVADEIETICAQVDSWRYPDIERSPLTVGKTRALASSLRSARESLAAEHESREYSTRVQQRRWERMRDALNDGRKRGMDLTIDALIEKYRAALSRVEELRDLVLELEAKVEAGISVADDRIKVLIENEHLRGAFLKLREEVEALPHSAGCALLCIGDEPVECSCWKSAVLSLLDRATTKDANG
jgi:hypothetical protein